MTDSVAWDMLKAAQDSAADLALLKGALAVESVTGNETAFARFLETHMAELGFQSGRGTFLKDRENTWGTTGGTGPNLMVVGHTDTVHVRGWSDHWGEDGRRDPFGATERGGQIWARGACDLKGGICAALAGYRLLRAQGHAPACNLTFAFIGDEESGEPGTGVSAGAKNLLLRVEAGEIPRPDFAIYVEPTSLNVYPAQIGFFIADITVTGKTAYFGTPDLGVDALKATHTILSKIWAHEKELSEGPHHPLVGASSILVTHIDGGGFIAVPGACKLSLIRKLRPGEAIDDAVAAFQAALDLASLPQGVRVQIYYPAGRDHPKGGSPVENAPDSAAIQLLQNCIARERPDAGQIGGAPYWSEMPFLSHQLGCPTVYCAPGDIAVAHTFEERIEIEEYLAAIRAFARFFAAFGARENKDRKPA